MKKLTLLLILVILLTNPINAKTTEETLYEGNSIEVPGYNITLIGIGSRENSIVACINNIIYIMDKGNKREIGNLKIEPARIYEDYAKLKITYSEEDICDESCSNIVCFGVQTKELEDNESAKEIPSEQQEIQPEQEGISINKTSIILFLIVLILLIILLFKKKR